MSVTFTARRPHMRLMGYGDNLPECKLSLARLSPADIRINRQSRNRPSPDFHEVACYKYCATAQHGQKTCSIAVAALQHNLMVIGFT